MCTIWDVRYFISTSGFRLPSSIFHSPWYRPLLKSVQLCYLMRKICGFRWSFTFIPSLMSGLSASGFPSTILISGWTASNCAQGEVVISSGDFVILKNKCSNVEFASRWFTPFNSMVTKFVKCSLKNHPHRLHFRWRNSKTGWTISKISTSFHQALMALGIHRNATENSVRAAEMLHGG